MSDGEPIQELSELLSRLPGLGRKSALRMVYHLLKTSPEFTRALGGAIGSLHERIRRCKVCGHYSGGEICPICADPGRDRRTICVVEHDQDLVSIESSQQYSGLFHVMHGALSPIDGIGPERLGLEQLRRRVRDEGIVEVIIATNPTPEGDTTALYIAKMLKETGVKVSRIATGLPVGGDIEYADRLTIRRSFHARAPIED